MALEPSDAAEQILRVSKVRGVVVISTLAGVNFLNTMGSGILIVALPQMARDLDIERGLILWPAAVYALSAGCLLLIFGAVADVVGAKRMWITGSFLFMVFTVAIGLAQSGIQLIMFRLVSGAAIAMCLPTAVGLITATFPKGTWRNTAFAMNGMGNPLGYAVGLVLGGVFTSSVGWRYAYYMMAGINSILSLASIWSLPAPMVETGGRKWQTRLAKDIDWVGALLMSAGLGMLLYVLAMTSSSYRRLEEPQIITLLSLSVVLIGSFPWWMNYQVRRGKPALIPNKVWRNWAFTSVCLAIFLCYAAMTAIEYFTTLYFQEVEGVSAMESSVRFIPHVVMGICANIATAYLIARVNVRTLAVVSALITLIAGPLMATVDIGDNYWFEPFWALFLSPANADVLFTISNLVISEAFPADLQSLAGGVFNEVTQFGNSVGLAITGAIAASVTEHSKLEEQPLALMKGYRAAFWTIFAANAAVIFVAWFGLRKAGIVGKKDV
ncbi:MFS general substrate transporter [Sarocladium strictum]